MKTCEEIRRDNLNRLIREAGGIPSLAERYGCTEPMIKSLQKGYKDSKSGTPKEIGRKVARDLEAVMGKEIGWMDHDHDEYIGQEEKTLILEVFLKWIPEHQKSL